MKQITVGHVVLNGMTCNLCKEPVEAGAGVFAQVSGQTLKLCDNCLSSLIRFRESKRQKETKQIGDTFYAEGDTPPAGPIGYVKRPIDPKVVYHDPVPEEPKEAPKYRPKIPPRPSR